MKKWTVTIRQEIVNRVFVDAETRDDARIIAQKMRDRYSVIDMQENFYVTNETEREGGKTTYTAPKGNLY